jgi:hypothetical protein
MATRKARVAVNGYGVIGKRVADAVMRQDDMELVGVADVVSDYRIKVAVERGYPIYASVPERHAEMEAAGILVIVSEATFYRWRIKYGGLEPSDAARLKELERENARLKKLLAERDRALALLKELNAQKG